ncbi:early nodulin-like protein 9 [Actinidia rufa]|uniref:Early nodulin-like protein 9 n=1 Tax=Actinidia rufa TaxID=165716 RepID=A0A7J0GNX0_9ERIC|nr:early nodulin-like protein 9 [Actinidia rufa]
MAKTILSSNHHDHKPFYVLGLFSVLLSIQEGVFEYPAEKDSVLQVTKKDYTNCNTASPMREFKDNGHTVFKFDQSGPFYFISGVEEKLCEE